MNIGYASELYVNQERKLWARKGISLIPTTRRTLPGANTTVIARDLIAFIVIKNQSSPPPWQHQVNT
jgi:hypothetical protein